MSTPRWAIWSDSSSGTIHSFCAHLLRERPVESGLAPGFSELDETEDAELRAEAWRDFLAHARTTGHPLLQELRDAGLKTGQLQKAFETVCDLEDVEFPTGNAQPPDVKDVWRKVDRFWADLSKLLPTSIDPETTCKVQQRAVRFRRELRIANARRERRGHSRAAAVHLGAAAGRRVECVGLTPPKTKVAHRDCRESASRDVPQRRRHALHGRLAPVSLSHCRHAADRGARDGRRRADAPEHVDVQRPAVQVREAAARARRCPHGPAVEASLALRGRVPGHRPRPGRDRVPAGGRGTCGTASAASAVSRKEHAPLDWRSVALRPGALFVVGDPKQSIYRFRRADIEIYNLVRARIAESASGAVIPLTTNFRSTAALCDWANSVFKSQFPSAATPHSPQYAPLEPAPGERVGTVRHEADPRKVKGASSRTVSGVCTLTMAEDVEESEVATVEAERIARFIRSEVDAGRRVVRRLPHPHAQEKRTGCFPTCRRSRRCRSRWKSAAPARSPSRAKSRRSRCCCVR